MQQNMQQRIEEDEIDLKELFKTIYKNRIMIIAISMTFSVVGAIYAYLKPNIYEATVMIEIGSNEKQSSFSFPSEALSLVGLSGGGSSLSTEMDLIQSRFILDKAIKKLDITQHCYVNKNLKKVELYEENPFEIQILKGYDVLFEVMPIDEKKYRLIVSDALNEEGNKWSYDEIHTYGSEVVSDNFSLTLKAIKPLEHGTYYLLRDDPMYKADNLMDQQLITIEESKNKSSFINISFEDTSALRATKFVNGLADVYIAQRVKRKVEDTSVQLNFVDDELKKINKEVSFDSQKTSTVSVFNRELKVKVLTEQIAAFEMKINEAIIEKKKLRYDYTESHPAVRRLSIQIKELQELVEKLQDNLQAIPIEMVVTEKAYPFLFQKHMELSMNKSSVVSQNRVIDYALLPKEPKKPKRKLIVVVSFITGLILGIFAVFLKEFLRSNEEYKEQN